MRQASAAFHLADDRIKRAVSVLRGTEVTQAGVRLGGEAFQKRGCKPRFANPRLARKQHHLAFTSLCPGPASKEQFEFFFPSHKRTQAAGVQRLETSFRRARPQRCPGAHRAGDALEILCPQVLQLEQIAEKLARGLGNDRSIRLGDPLQARREVRRLADYATLLRLSRPDQVANYDQASGNADTGLQRSIRLEAGHRRDQLQPRPDRPLGVVLMGLGIAEIDQCAVAHVFRHEAAETAHGLGNASLISRNDLAQVLRVHTGGERRRTDQVTKHDGNVPAFGGIVRLRFD